MSLELSEGKVKMNFDLGSGVGSAISENRHNDGHWKSLTMARNKKQGTHNNNENSEKVDFKVYYLCLSFLLLLMSSLTLYKSHDDCSGHRQRC